MRDSSTYQAILEEGAVQQAQKMLVRQGSIRFGKPDRKTLAAIEAVGDLGRLDYLAERILQVDSWKELLLDR